MTDPDVGTTVGLTVELVLDDGRVESLHRWAEIGHRTVEETVLAAIDEYLMVTEH